MAEPITSILDVRLPQPDTEEWRQLPADIQSRVNIALELRNVVPDTIVEELDRYIIEALFLYANHAACAPEG